MENRVEILLVEDDPADLAFTLRELTNRIAAERIAVARDGEEALNFLFGRGDCDNAALDHVKLVVLDLKLPKVDGIEVLRQIKSRPQTQALPVVVMTSSAQESDLHACYQLGVNSYVQKPVNFDRFHDVVQAMGLYWLEMNLPPQRTG